MERTRFIGRTTELTKLDRLWDTDRRLVTLTGPAGIGKTRLADRHLSQAHGPWGEVRKIAARTLHTVDELSEAVVGCAPFLGDPELDGARGRHGRMLLVLDGLEALLPDAGSIIARWLDDTPGLRILCLSRRRLGIEGEAVVEVPPVEVPAPGRVDAENEAVALFIDRIRLGRTDFDASPEALERIAEIARRTEGVPLAIVLAASRAELLGLDGLLERLESDPLLGGDGSSPLDRSILEKGLLHSLDHLEAEERLVLAQSSVFPASFRVEAAEAILEVNGPGVLSILERLRHRSLVRDGGHPGRLSTFRMIHELVQRDLAPSDRRRVELAHARYYARRVPRERLSPEDVPHLEAVVNRAISWTDTLEGIELALAAAARLEWMWSSDRAAPASIQSSTARALTHLIARVPTADESAAPRDRLASLFLLHGRLAWRAGRAEESARDAGRAAELAREAGALGLERRACLQYGDALHYLDRLEEACEAYRAGLALDVSDRWADRTALCLNLAACLVSLGRSEEGRGWAEEGLEIARRHGLGRLVTRAEHHIAVADYHDGRHVVAMAKLGRCIEEARESGDTPALTLACAYLGLFHLDRDDPKGAEPLLDEAVRAVRRVGHTTHEGYFRAVRAAARATLDHIEDAAEDLRVARRLLAGDALSLTIVSVHQGHLHLACMRKAARIGDAVEVQRELAQAQRALDGTDADAAYAPRTAATRSDDVRVAIAILERALERAAARVRNRGEQRCLTLGPDAAWMSIDHGTRISIRRRRLIQRLLVAFCNAHTQREGGLTANELFAAGWPREKEHDDVLRNRLHVALNELRKLGLRDLIRYEDDRYHLADELVVVAT